MALTYKIKLNFDYFEKVVQVPKILENMFALQKKYNTEMARTVEAQETLIKGMKDNHEAAGRIWLAQKKLSFENLKMKLQNPWPMFIEGAQKFGMVLKGMGLTAIMAVLGGIMAIGKKAFDFNIGGMKSGFVTIMGKVSQAFATLVKGFYSLVRSLDPVLKPFMDFIVKGLGGIIDGFMEFIGLFGNAMGGIEGVKKLVGGLVESFMSFFKIIGDVWKSVAEGFGGGGALAQGLSKALKLTVEFIGAVLKLGGAIIQFGKSCGIFWILGAAISAIVEVFNDVFWVVNKIIEAVAWLLNGITKLLDFMGLFAGIKIILNAISQPFRDIAWLVDKIIKGVEWLIGLFTKSKDVVGSSNQGATGNTQNIPTISKGGAGNTSSTTNSAVTNIYTQQFDKAGADALSNTVVQRLSMGRRAGY